MTPLLCAQLIDVLTTGEEVCWAELPPRTTGGISPPQLHLTMLANCFRAPMSDRLRLASCAYHMHIATVGRLRYLGAAAPPEKAAHMLVGATAEKPRRACCA